MQPQQNHNSLVHLLAGTVLFPAKNETTDTATYWTNLESTSPSRYFPAPKLSKNMKMHIMYSFVYRNNIIDKERIYTFFSGN